MKNSLEVRSPFQDKKLVEYILSCDLGEKFSIIKNTLLRITCLRIFKPIY